jgi:prepilin-type N-terminal cleavage/methylation domain-containing protein
MGVTVGNNKGFSLIELMVAVVIIAVAMLALSSVMINAITVNLGNDLRNTAMRLTQQTAETLLALPIENINSCGLTPDKNASNYNSAYTYDNSNICLGIPGEYKKYPDPVQSIKGFQQPFNIAWSATTLSDNLRQITISVSYRHRDENHVHDAVVYKHLTP